jgi:hypothetical protein
MPSIGWSAWLTVYLHTLLMAFLDFGGVFMGIIVYKLGICSCTWSYPRVSLLFHRGIKHISWCLFSHALIKRRKIRIAFD